MLLLSGLLNVNAQQITYPITEKIPVTDTIWGRPVEDPYRWLEDIRSDKTANWLTTQEELTKKYSGKLSESLGEHLTNYSRIKSKNVSKHGKYYFSSRTLEINKPPALYYHPTRDEEPKFLFDPSTLGNGIAVDGISISPDNKILALLLSRNGGDWKTIRFISIDDRKLLEDSVIHVKFSPIYWSENGIFYIEYDVKNTDESFTSQIQIKALRYHTLNSAQESDVIVYTPKSKYDGFKYKVTPSNKYLILSRATERSEKKTKIVSYRSLPLNNQEEFKEIIHVEGDYYYGVLGEIGDKLIISSNRNAPNGVIYKCDPKKLNSLEKLIPQYKEQLVSAELISGNKIISLYNGDKRSFAVIFDSTGAKLKSWMIPEGFSFSGLSYVPGDSVLIYTFNSFFNPSSVYEVNLNTLEQTSLSKTIVPFSYNELVTEIVYYYSKDSTKIPMYLTHKKNIKLNENNPTILYGYGGFGISTNPFFDVSNIPFLNSGGILAVPKLRGGGDFPNWHELGMKLNKQNTFDDFISAAEYLIANKYTNPKKLAIMGGSNGGLLVGACMTQRPELFGAAVSIAGVLDMMRYHLFNIGYVYEDEYGNIEDSTEFINLATYSPVQNVKKGVDYPPTLLIASNNDDRVNPFHSFKFLSQLQEKGSGKNPYILFYQENAGHTGNRVFEDRMKIKSITYSFIYKYLGMEGKVYFED